MSNSKLTGSERNLARGQSLLTSQLQLAPEHLLIIAEREMLTTKGVVRHAVPPAADIQHRKDGILLTINENCVIFDIYVIMDANVNIMETSRQLQSAVAERVKQMSGLQVNAINIHVEDVAYPVV